MVQILNEALAAINRLIEGASLRQRGFDKDSGEWHTISVELEAYGRAFDVLLQLSEKRDPEFEMVESGLPMAQAGSFNSRTF